MRIKELCAGERPREKMAALGAENLSVAELLAILLRTGTGGRSSLDLGHELLRIADGSLVSLSRMSQDSLRAVSGIGPVKALELGAALELGWRMYSEAPGLPSAVITDAVQVAVLLQPRLRGLRHEECWVLMLDGRHHILRKERVSVGGWNGTALDLREVVRRSLDAGASSLILVHNHPSGTPRPSLEDIRQTEALQKACKSMDISLLDHVIVGNGQYYSFADERVCRIPMKEKHF